MVFVTQKKSVYVDSVAGSNANDGLTANTPKATCSAGLAVLASSGRKTLRLKCGSFFREMITLPAGKRLKSYGSGDRPILDPRENITGTWTLYGAAYTYQQTVNHALSSPSVHRVWEDGVRLVRVANAAACEATAGTFYAAIPSGTTGVIYIHPNGDGNPNSNGKTYSYSFRMYGVNMGDGCVVDGIKTGWNGGNDGSIRALARNCVIRNCDAIDGAKHHVLISEGLCENVNAYDAETTAGIGSQIAFVAYNDFITGQSAGLAFKRCTVDYVVMSANTSIGFYGHGGIGLTKVLFEDCTVKNAGYAAFGQIQTDNTIISRCVAVNCTAFAKAERSGANFYIYRCRSIAGANSACGALIDGVIKSNAYIRHSESQIVGTPGIRVVVDNVTVDARYCTFTPLSGVGKVISAMRNGAVRIENCIGWAPNSVYVRNNSFSFTGGSNLYYSNSLPTGAAGWSVGIEGAAQWTFAQWKAGSGQDQNSVIGLPVITTPVSEASFTVFDPTCPVFTSGFTCGVQATDDSETLALLAGVGYTP